MNTTLPWLEERMVKSVSYDPETDQWSFDFGDKVVLQIGSPWRVMKNDGIAHGHLDHGQQFGLPEPVDGEARAADLLKDRAARAATVVHGSADLIVDLGSGVRLEVFNNSSGHEGWLLHAPDGRSFIAQGGGRLVEWNRGP